MYFERYGSVLLIIHHCHLRELVNSYPRLSCAFLYKIAWSAIRVGKTSFFQIREITRYKTHVRSSAENGSSSRIVKRQNLPNSYRHLILPLLLGGGSLGYAIPHFRNFSPYFRKSANRNWLFQLSARVLNKYTVRIPQKR